MNQSSIRKQYKEYLKLRKSKNINKKIMEFDRYMNNRIGGGEKECVLVSDELIDFFDVLFHKVKRFESFARKIRRLYPPETYPRVLEVGCGVLMDLSLELTKYGYEITGVDPNALSHEELLEVRNKLVNMKLLLDAYEKEMRKVTIVKDSFDYKTADLTNYDLIVGLEPCEATEHILRGSLQYHKPCIIGLCATAHESLDGTVFENRFLWYDYLKSIDPSFTTQEVWIQENHHMLIYTKQLKK